MQRHSLSSFSLVFSIICCQLPYLLLHSQCMCMQSLNTGVLVPLCVRVVVGGGGEGGNILFVSDNIVAFCVFVLNSLLSRISLTYPSPGVCPSPSGRSHCALCNLTLLLLSDRLEFHIRLVLYGCVRIRVLVWSSINTNKKCESMLNRNTIIVIRFKRIWWYWKYKHTSIHT